MIHEEHKSRSGLRITINAPVILTYGLLCVIVTVLNYVTDGYTNRAFFTTYRSSLKNLWTYVRLFTHVLGHSGWTHLIGNMSYILLLGPLLEEKYGSKVIAEIILVVAVVTSLFNSLFFPMSGLLGASGVCFAFILLSSIAGVGKGEIPLTFILVAVIYLGQQVYQGIWLQDNISNLAHIVGGVIGALYGFLYMRKIR